MAVFTGCAILEKDQSSRPSSTSSMRSKEQLHEFLQRHIQQHQQQQQAGSTSHRSTGQVSQHHTSFSTQSLQQLLLRRQQQQQQHTATQPMKQEIRPQRILPRPSSSYDHQSKVVSQFLAPLAEGQRAIVMALCPSCVRASVRPCVRPCNLFL